MNTKKLLTLSLCLIIATISSLSAQAVGEKFKVGQLYYQITNLSPNQVAVVPQKTNTPYWNENEKPTGEITIPTSIAHNETTYSVTSIGKSAFQWCDRLATINIPNSVTSIGEQAFDGCRRLTSITIPNSVTSIGKSAFQYCQGLTAIQVNNQNANYTDVEGVLFNKDKTTLIAYPNAKAETYTIPNSVTKIGNGAFARCTGLTAVTIPNSVTSIRSSAFLGCTRLTSVTIPNSVTSIEKLAFYQCIRLTSVNIPSSVTSIGDGAFQWCRGLRAINVDNQNANYTDVEGVLFNKDKTILITYPNEKAKTYTIPNSVTNIGEDAFANCQRLTSVTIPNSVASIGTRAFYQCIRLTSVNIPNSVTSIGKQAFYICTGLTRITSEIADLSQLTIGEDIFYGVDKNKCILYVPQGKVADYQAAEQWKEFTKIGEIGKSFVGEKFKIGQLYYQITNLSPKQVAVVPQKTNYPYWNDNEKPTGEITIPTSIAHNETTYSVTSIEQAAFYKFERLTSVNIPNSITSIGESAFHVCNRLTAIHVDNQNANYTDIEGVLFNKDKTTLITYPNAKTKTYTIPNSVTSIGKQAFYNSELTSINIPNSVTSIGAEAFYSCYRLTSIIIPNSVTKIGDTVFRWCERLTAITIPNSVTSIGQSAFSNCRGLTSVTIPNSVTSIGDRAFNSCTGLTKITSEIADLSQLTIDRYLFYGVDQNKCILYVPQGKVADYQAAEQWKEFTNIKEIEGTGISQVDAERYIALYPNPAREKVTLHIAPALVEQVSSLTLLDSNGKALQRQPITGSETNIDLTHCTSGIYFVQIDNVVKKLIIK